MWQEWNLAKQNRGQRISMSRAEIMQVQQCNLWKKPPRGEHISMSGAEIMQVQQCNLWKK